MVDAYIVPADQTKKQFIIGGSKSNGRLKSTSEHSRPGYFSCAEPGNMTGNSSETKRRFY